MYGSFITNRTNSIPHQLLPIVFPPPARRDRDVKIRNTRQIHHPGRLRGKRGRDGMILRVAHMVELAQFDETGAGDGEEEGRVVIHTRYRLLIRGV